MMGSTPLILTDTVRRDLEYLRSMAVGDPIDVTTLANRLRSRAAKERHLYQMTRQSVVIPGQFCFLVTYSIEVGHPAGVCRHMSMSIEREGRVPSPEAVWMIAECLGFVGGITSCISWRELLQGHGLAISLVQRVATGVEGSA
jgi:hypothetical protein